jgi:predicted nucleotidyltransferase
MGKKDIIEILRNYKNEVANQYNILTIGVFGSVARGESGDESDVDIVIRISEPDFFMLAGIKEDLEQRLNKSIDIVTYTDSMNPFLKNRIDHEAVYA